MDSSSFSRKYYTGAESVSTHSTEPGNNYAAFSCTYPYPYEAAENSIKGVVIISFDIDDCQFKNIKIDKGLGNGLDETAIYIVTEMSKEFQKNPKFCSCMGYQKGHNIFPIKFSFK
jgi:hypothetical protein